MRIMEIVENEWKITYRGSNPRTIVLELTTRCNLRCSHCFRNTMEEEFIDLPINIAEKILLEAHKMNTKRIVLTGFGEPLVYKDIDRVLMKAKALGFEIILNTNGTLLSKYIDEVANYVDTVIVSIEASEEDLYREIRRGGTLCDVINGLEEINKVRESKNSWKPVLEFWCTVNKKNVDRIPQVIELARKLRIFRLTVSNYIPIDTSDSCCLCDSNCLDKLEKVLNEISKDAIEKPPLIYCTSSIPLADRLCPYISQRALFIRSDSGITPCVHYSHRWRYVLYGIERRIKPVIFGYLSKQSLYEIWNSREYTLFRYRTYFTKYPSCLTCSLAQYCSYTITNECDCLGYTPTCAHCPYLHRIAICPL